MSGKVEMALSVLFAHELRLAAKAIKDANEDPSQEKIIAAFKASWTALYHVMEFPDNPIVVVDLSQGAIKEVAREANQKEGG